jgi:hypothetical protein
MKGIFHWMALALSAIVLLTVAAPTANAYVVLFDQYGNYRSWKKATVQWAVAANGSKDLTMDEIKSALGAAFNAWQEVSCSGIKFTFGGIVSANPNKDIFIRWWENSWFPEAADAAGLTTNWNVSPSSGPKKVEIFFNGLDFSWATSGTDDPFSNANDVQAVATHEIGHAIGLSHPRHRFASMFFSGFPGQSEEKRTLEDDDKRGACFLYGTVQFTQGQPCDACWQNSQCQNGVCLDYGGTEGAYCTEECSANKPCPQGFSCYNISGVSTPQCVAENEHCAPIGGNIKTGEFCYGPATCKSGLCLVLPESAVCSMDCNPNAPGNGGCPGDMVCLSGKSETGICFPKGDGKLGDDCLSPADCASFDCVGIGSGKGVCTSSCVTDGQCPGGYKCVIDFCLKKGSKGFGDSCETMTACQSAFCAPIYKYCTDQCESNAECPSGSKCLGLGFCDAGATGEVDEVCGKGEGAKDCKGEFFCFYQEAGVETGTCKEGCDARFDSGCSGGTFCQWFYQDWAKKVVGVCVPDNGGADQGATCGGSLICKPHLVCANTDGLGPKCRQDCNAKNFLGCKGGATCIPLNLSDNPKLGACHPKDEAPAVENPRVVETMVADDPDPELGGGSDGEVPTTTGGDGTGTDGGGSGPGTGGSDGVASTDGIGGNGGGGGDRTSGGCQTATHKETQSGGATLLFFLALLSIQGLRRRHLHIDLH